MAKKSAVKKSKEARETVLSMAGIDEEMFKPTMDEKALKADGWEEAGAVAVDSGQLMVCDPCYIESNWAHNDDAEYHEERQEAKPRRFSYGGACEATLQKGSCGNLTFNLGHDGAGFATSTAWGDGYYPVYIKRGKNGRPCAMLVVME